MPRNQSLNLAAIPSKCASLESVTFRFAVNLVGCSSDIRLSPFLVFVDRFFLSSFHSLYRPIKNNSQGNHNQSKEYHQRYTTKQPKGTKENEFDISTPLVLFVPFFFSLSLFSADFIRVCCIYGRSFSFLSFELNRIKVS